MENGKYKVLIVDDEEVNASFLTEVLEDASFLTVVATDGLEALGMLQQFPDIDIILLDRMMPNMDGISTMEEIRKNPKWAVKPVIMQTAAGSTSDVIEGSATGVYYYLTKPFDDNMVLSVVQAAVGDIERQ